MAMDGRAGEGLQPLMRSCQHENGPVYIVELHCPYSMRGSGDGREVPWSAPYHS